MNLMNERFENEQQLKEFLEFLQLEIKKSSETK